MLNSRALNNKVNRLYEKALRLVYRNKISLRNLKILATEICKAKNDLIPEIMKDIFCFVEKTYNLKSNSTLKRSCNDSLYFDTENISSLAPEIWEFVPNEIKHAVSLESSEKKLIFRPQINVLIGFVKYTNAI